MLATRRNQLIVAVVFIAVVAVLLGIYANSALAGSNKSTSDVYWTWDMSDPVGSSNLVRNKNGISAEYSTSELPGGQAMTLWFIVFNNPEDCVAGAFDCGLADMGAARPAQGDFLLASGHVIDADGTATFAGNLKVGDIGGSGLAEFPGGCIPNMDDCGGSVGLVDVEGALIVLALHSHGPELTGQELKSQTSSFLGGCELPFIGTGPGGFAASYAEIAVNTGDCSTFQISPHPPN